MDDCGPREIVALARWQFPYSLSAEERAEKEEVQASTPARPEGYNGALEREFNHALDSRSGKWVDDSKDYGASCLDCASTLRHVSHRTDRHDDDSPPWSRGLPRASTARAGFSASSLRPR